jgi:hypothetical protein
MGRNAGGNYSGPHIFHVWDAKVFGRSYITEKVSSSSSSNCSTNSCCDVIMARGNIRG